MEEGINKQLIHAGVETVVIGGLVFWIQRKNNALQSEIDQLREQLSQCQQALQQQGQMLSQHNQIIQQLINGGNLPPPQLPKNPEPPQRPSPQPAPQPPRNTGPPSRSRQPESSPNPSYTPPQPSQEDLDKLLEEELGKANHNSSDPEYIEIECSEETCEIPKVKKRKKKVEN